jgi:hypothetical protein
MASIKDDVGKRLHIMSKKAFYRQCRLQRGNSETVSWIPSEFAKIGWVLSLKNNEDWTHDWKVLSAGSEHEGKLVENQAHNSGNIWEPSANLTSRGKK